MERMEWVIIFFGRTSLRLLLQDIWSHLTHCEDLIAVPEVVELRYVVVCDQGLGYWVLVKGFYIGGGEIFEVNVVQMGAVEEAEICLTLNQVEIYDIFLVVVVRVDIVNWLVVDLLFVVLWSLVYEVCWKILLWWIVYVGLNFTFVRLNDHSVSWNFVSFAKDKKSVWIINKDYRFIVLTFHFSDTIEL